MSDRERRKIWETGDEKDGAERRVVDERPGAEAQQT